VHGDPRRGGVFFGQQPGGSRMRRRPRARAYLAGHCAADERVAEVERSTGREDPRVGQRVGGLGGDGGGESGDRRRVAERDVLSQHRHDTRQRGGFWRAQIDPREHGVHDVLGVERQQHRVRIPRPIRDGSGELAEKEWIPASGGVAPGTQLVSGARHELAHQAAGATPAQGPWMEDGGIRPHEGRSDPVAVQIARGAAGYDEQHRERLDSPAQVRDQAQRCRVSPVGIVYEYRDRLPRREVCHQPVERVDRGQHGVPARRRHVARTRGRGRKKPPSLHRRAREEVLRGRVALEHGLEQLARDTEAEVALELPPARHQPAQARGRGGSRGRVQQHRLPDPRRALDYHHAASAGGGGRDGRRDDFELAGSLQQLTLAKPLVVAHLPHGAMPADAVDSRPDWPAAPSGRASIFPVVGP
jgi:hypothetical protein